MAGAKPWPPEIVERAEALWAEGRTGSQIAAELGITRNAVIGHAHRHDWPKHFQNPKIGREPRAARTIKRAQAAATKLAQPMPLPPVESQSLAHPVALIDLKSNGCHWPLGGATGDHWFYCGAKVAPGYSFCEPHCRLAYQNWGAHRVAARRA